MQTACFLFRAGVLFLERFQMKSESVIAFSWTLTTNDLIFWSEIILLLNWIDTISLPREFPLKITSLLYIAHKKKLTCKQLVFCSQHVYEYEEVDEKRAERRKIAVIEQYIRCFE